MRVIDYQGKRYAIAERVSPEILIFAQATGRWSQKGPPDAQLPVRMRQRDIPDPGWVMLGYDLSNAELRVVSVLSGDEILTNSFLLGWDAHTLNACDLLGMEYPPNRVKKAIHHGEECASWREYYDWQGEEDPRRKFGKVYNFRALYGGQPKSAYKIPGANKLGRTRQQLEEGGYIWLSKHPKLQDFWNRYGDEAIKRYISRNPFGRRRILSNPKEDGRFREGINHPMQSFVADLVNIVVIETYCECNGWIVDSRGRYINKEQESCITLEGQRHDSLLWQIKEEVYEDTKSKVLEIVQRPRTLGNLTYQFPVDYYEKRSAFGKLSNLE